MKEKQEIKKQTLLAEPLSDKAMKLARAMYHTYITYDDLSMEIKFSTFFKLLDLHPCKDSLNDVQWLLEELNEPLAVKNFEYDGKTTQLKFIQFCNYSMGKETFTVELCAETLYAHEHYMADTFLDFK